MYTLCQGIKGRTYRRKSLDTSVANCDNKGRFCGGVHLQVQARVVRRHEKTDDESTSDVEQQDADIDPPNGLGEIMPGVLGFAGGDLSFENASMSERASEWKHV